MDSYIASLAERDLDDIDPGASALRLQRVLRLLAANQSGELVKARLARQAEMSESTLSNYLDVLESMYLAQQLPPMTNRLTVKQVGRRKVSLLDPLLAWRMAGVAPEQLRELVGNEFLGPLLEGFVVGELLKQASWSETEFQLSHYRDRDGYEVDMVIEVAGGGVIGVEVKATGTVLDHHLRGLRKLADRTGTNFLGGVVLHTGKQGMSFGNNIWTLPLASLWEHATNS